MSIFDCLLSTWFSESTNRVENEDSANWIKWGSSYSVSYLCIILPDAGYEGIERYDETQIGFLATKLNSTQQRQVSQSSWLWLSISREMKAGGPVMAEKKGHASLHKRKSWSAIDHLTTDQHRSRLSSL